MKHFLTHAQVDGAAQRAAIRIDRDFPDRKSLRAYAVPRGGIPAAYLITRYTKQLVTLCDDHAEADIILDDLIDSGITRRRFDGRPFYALFNKIEQFGVDHWIVFPWDESADASALDIPIRLLQYVGEDPARGGLHETPKRFLKAWDFWTSGYDQDPVNVLKVFEDGAEKCDEIVLVKDIPIYSQCVIGSTFVETPKGRIPISKLHDGDLIYTVDPKTMELGLVPCSNPRITRKDAKLVRVYTDNDTVICTPDHLFLTVSGDWIQAAKLTYDTALVSLYRKASHTKQGHVDLIASRYTRYKGGLIINGETKGWPEHRFVMKTQGHHLAEERLCVVHHKDGVPWNNEPFNLELLTIGEHNKRHDRTLRLANSTRRKKAAAKASGQPATRKKRSDSVKAHWAGLSEEERRQRKQAMRDGIKSARNHRVIGVEKLDYIEDTWCLTVPGTHTFFANGIAVHNCEHHLAPFFGVAHVGYIPDGKIVGLSKLSRLVDVFARRLQVQERLTNQVVDALNDILKPKGAAVVIECRHLCMESRGIQRQGATTVTSAMRGVFMDDGKARSEFLDLVR